LLMRNPLPKITGVFVFITLLPIAFVAYELGMLNKNEAIVRETYQNQLDAILYSVNQYSDDIISSWASRIRMQLPESVDSANQYALKIREHLNQTDVVRHIYFSDLKGKSVLYNVTESDEPLNEIKSTMDSVVAIEKERIVKLMEYEKAGFRKMEAIDHVTFDQTIPILFVQDENKLGFVIGAMLIDLPSFIEQNLGPKMQAISQEKFIISARQLGNDSLIYSTATSDRSGSTTEEPPYSFKSEVQRKDFWILPGYYLGISLKGATIDDLVKSRTTTSLIILTLLVLILFAGILFLYRNIRREIHLSQAKSEFVSNVSHEIRTPLSLIGMFAETLEAGRVTSEEKKKEYYSIITKETIRLSRIVNRILNFSQLDANKKQFTFVPIQLNELCKEILENYFYHLNEKGFTFDFCPAQNLGVIQGDRESISEAIINLLDNAVKYSRENKLIMIKTGRDFNFRYVEIKDEGIGIEKKYQQEIFEQFYRAPTGDVHTTKGSGLGLSLVKKIMDAHQGHVTVESYPEKGSTFRLKFPVQKNETT
jgi:two-component system, OmpR family, phosphate regulon sensor histidine kinase PhoR